MSNELKVILTLVDNMSKNLAGVQSNFSNFGKQMDNMIGTVGKVAGAFGAILAVEKGPGSRASWNRLGQLH